MCNLYGHRVERWEMLAHYQAVDDWRDQIPVEKDYTAAPAPGKPGNPGYVVREDEGRRILSTMRWGFPRAEGKAVVNVRNYQSNFWRSALKTPAQRCLVPFTRFEEWSATPDPVTGKKTRHWFNLPSQPIGSFAGIWRPTETDPVYAFLTCGYSGTDDPEAEATAAATHIVGRIHPKACPVILHPEDYDRWLRAPIDEALALAVPFPSQLMAVS